MSQFMSFIIKTAFWLAAIGILKPASMYFAKEAAEAQKHPFSLSKWNKALQSGGSRIK